MVSTTERRSVGSGSIVTLDARTTLVTVPMNSGWTRSVSVTVSPGPTASNVHLTVPPSRTPPPVDETYVTLPGRESTTSTLRASSGPSLETLISYTMVSSRPTLPGPVFRSDRSASGSTTVVATDRLSERSPSGLVVETRATSVSSPLASTRTTTLSMRDPPGGTVPASQVTARPDRIPPAELDSTVTPPGRESTTMTPAAGPGPAFEVVST